MNWNIPNMLTVARLLAAPGVAIMFLYFTRPYADWFALALFVIASLTDFLDGYLARLWKQESKFGTMLDPIADKAMVVIALLVITGYTGMNPWLILPATVILFREVFVSGLREFLGADAGKLAVTKLAKWKTTAQMVAIAVLFLGMGLEQVHLNIFYFTDPTDYQMALDDANWNRTTIAMEGGFYAGIVGIVLMWFAAILTAITGFDYFSKAMPYLRDDPRND